MQVGVASLLLLSLLLPAAVAAGEPVAAVPVPKTLDEAQQQRQRARALREQAERDFQAEQDRCYTLFLVNDCLEQAKRRRIAAIIESRAIDQPARDFERAARRQEVADEDAQRRAEQPQRAAEQLQQGERHRAEQAEKAAARERKLAEKQRQAAEGRQKTAEEQARRQARQEKRARDDAERAARKAAREEGKPATAGN